MSAAADNVDLSVTQRTRVKMVQVEGRVLVGWANGWTTMVDGRTYIFEEHCRGRFDTKVWKCIDQSGIVRGVHRTLNCAVRSLENRSKWALPESRRSGAK